MDGTDSRILVKTDLLNPTSLLYHAKSNKIYWTDTGRKKIESISVNDAQNSRTQVVSDVESPTGIAIWDGDSATTDQDSFSILYYADQVQEALVAFNLKTSEKRVLRNNVPHIEQLKLYQKPQTQAYGSGDTSVSPCLTNNGGCHQICLPSKNERTGRQCRCSNGLELQAQDNSCRPYRSFIFFATDTTIRALTLTGDISQYAK